MDSVGYWLKDIPYIWVSDGKRHFRYYLTHGDDWVYVEYTNAMGKKVYLRHLQKDIQRGVFEKTVSQYRNVYRIKPQNICNRKALDLFRVYNPYLAKIPIKNIKNIDLRINGQRVNPLNYFYYESQSSKEAYAFHSQPSITDIKVLDQNRREIWSIISDSIFTYQG